MSTIFPKFSFTNFFFLNYLISIFFFVGEVKKICELITLLKPDKQELFKAYNCIYHWVLLLHCCLFAVIWRYMYTFNCK